MQFFTTYDTSETYANRIALVQAIRQKGISCSRVLSAISAIPRHIFINASHQHLAYADKAVPIGEGQTISQPFTVAYQTELLNLHPRMKVLEIGTGSGYQSALLATMQAEVYTIERQALLFKENLDFAYLNQFSNLHLFFGDGFNGLPESAPFDRIIITAAVPEMPEILISQLVTEGILVMPYVTGNGPQEMMRITKRANGSLLKEHFGKFSFVPMLHGTQ